MRTSFSKKHSVPVERGKRGKGYLDKWVLLLTVYFAFTVGVKADVVEGTIMFWDNADAYSIAAGTSDWAFGNFTDELSSGTTNGVRWQEYGFKVTNVVTKDVVNGSLIASGMNGWGGALTATSTGGGAGFSLSHNTAHMGTLTFGLSLANLVANNFIDSFYVAVAPHDASNGYKLGVTAVASDGTSLYQEMNYQSGGFFGFTLEDGYFTEIIVSVLGGKPNGGFDGLAVGFGNGIVTPPPSADASVPEPATLAVMGLGLAGLAVARRKMRK